MNKILWFIVAIMSFATVFLLITDGEISVPSINIGSENEEIVVTEEVEEDVIDIEEIATEEVVESEPIESVTAQIPEPTPVPVVKALPTHDEDGNIIVRYTTYGFDPQTIEVEPGDAVRFLNTNISSMWVKAQAHPTAEYFEYASLNQGRSSYMGESYVFTFTQVGSWGYINLNKDTHKGVIIVVE